MAESSKRVRSANWTEREKILLMESVREREEVLFGKFTGSGGQMGLSNKAKDKGWEDVAAAVNAYIKKQYDNIKQRAKGKLDELKRPKTGGGPVPKEQSVYEKI
ncbi:uncharacterized protein LOC132564712 [Ylistrum balloti]|uniref:uncharacterized protein LOC132564712 n=1 Tax=Ylistrum balloti TaxID=509963 RepID=UPI002905B909|nr:uncharacterized protein LOC132564712 [Ylistrum balloti]